jgi:hypothetical protein
MARPADCARANHTKECAGRSWTAEEAFELVAVQRKAGQDGPAHAVQVDADADERLHRAESEVKGASERAKLLWREMKLGLER